MPQAVATELTMNHIIPPLTTSPPKPADAGIRTLATFLDEEADALIELLHTLGEIDAADALDKILQLVDRPHLHASRIAGALSEVRTALEEVPIRDIENIARSRAGPRDLDAMVCWYGARVTELAKGLNR
jgi:hypothetical protein